MAKMSVQELHNEIAGSLEKLSDLFVSGMKLTFIARFPGNGEADVLVGDDNDAEEIIALIQRRFCAIPAEQPAKVARSIKSDPQFLALVADVQGFDDGLAVIDDSVLRLIAHIDAWAARSDGAASSGEQEPAAGSMTVIREAIADYYRALNNRSHGGLAMDRAFRAIERETGMSWDMWTRAESTADKDRT